VVGCCKNYIKYASTTCGKLLVCHLAGRMEATFLYMLKENSRLMIRSWCCLCVSEFQRSNLLNDFPKYTVDKVAGSA